MDERDDIARLDSWVRWGIWIAGTAGLTALARSFFNWDGFVGLVAATAPEAVAKLAVLLYYVCWQVGAPMDLTLHKKVLVKDSKRGEFDRQLVGGLIFFFLIAFGMMWATSHDYLLVLAVLGFWTVLTILGQMVRDRTQAMFWDSWRWYKQRNMCLDAERTARVSQYFYGPQMKLRNKVGFVLIGIACIATIPQVRAVLGSGAHALLPLLPETTAAALVPSIFFALFVIVTEAWQYAMRLNTFAAISVLDELKRRYYVEPYLETDAAIRAAEPSGELDA